MTTLSLAPSNVRPVPWRRLGWVVWRRYRTTVLAITALLAVIAAYLLITGHQARAAYATVLACTPANSQACHFGLNNFRNTYGNQPGVFTIVMVLVPGIIGVFAGAPMLSREFETGTFRYTWTQGAGRMRWAIAVLVSGAIGVAVAGLALGALVTWSAQPLISAGMRQRLDPSAFPITGIAIAGWAIFGFTLGAFAGRLFRRVLPALGVSFAVWFGFAAIVSTFRRYHYLRPLITTNPQLGINDFEVSNWWTKGGVRASTSQLNSVLQAIGIQTNGSQNGYQVAPGPGGSIDPNQYLLQHGFQQVTSYQPASRFWTFQWIEFGWLACLSLILLGATVWLLRRR